MRNSIYIPHLMSEAEKRRQKSFELIDVTEKGINFTHKGVKGFIFHSGIKQMFSRFSVLDQGKIQKAIAVGTLKSR